MSNREREDPREAEQDAALERAWRDGSTEQPSARVDAAILTAAQKAAAERNRIPVAAPARLTPLQRWSRWAPMAAAATVAGLAFVLVQTLPRDPDRAPLPPAAQESAPVAAPAGAPPPAATPPASAARQELSPPRARDTVDPAAPERRSTADVTAAPQVVPGPAAAAARNMAAEAVVDDQALVTDEWVQKIAALHAAGDIAAAEDTLRAFRAAVPDADRYLPESFSEWAASVR
jgi:hypothetical protein